METRCFHCGDKLPKRVILFEEKSFCCVGCKGVYHLLSENQLADFYSYEQSPGIKPTVSSTDKYAFLDIAEIRSRFIKFEDSKQVKVVLTLPNIHCSSCIYLLENAQKALPGILHSQVHFTKKEASITYLKDKLTLGELALFLDRIGYPPNFQKKGEILNPHRGYLLKLGLAGFAFGSIMLWSFPEYTGIAKDDLTFRNFTSWLTLIVSFPVLIISAREYYLSAYKAIRAKHLNLDIPITLGIFALYLQSVLAITNHEGPGYMDSFAGFIFFLLIGKGVQNRTYQALSFDRDYTSYFPLAVRIVKQGKEEILPIEQIEVGDEIKIRHQEIIPCDSTLLDEETLIDYSFVTGESEGPRVLKGGQIFAGGKVLNAYTHLRVNLKTDRSHLTQLWNERLENQKGNQGIKYQDRISAYFLWAVLSICAVSALFYSIYEPSLALKVIASILIVACPCALALSGPFTYGNAMRKMGHLGAYLKNTGVVEKMSEINTIVFDKTGTLTDTRSSFVQQNIPFQNSLDRQVLLDMVKASMHPMSSSVLAFLQSQNIKEGKETSFNSFEEHMGKGLKTIVGKDQFVFGNALFTGQLIEEKSIYFTKNGQLIASFSVQNQFREGLGKIIHNLPKNFEIYVLSGDNERDLSKLVSFGISREKIHFHQSPKDKVTFIESFQRKGNKIMMIGDGLNDAAALAQAHVGIALSEDMFKFTPSSDVILDATKLHHLPNFIHISEYARRVLKICLGFSITYNLTGIYFAVSAQLTPLIAAILMPLSSITIVGMSTLLIHLKFRQLKN